MGEYLTGPAARFRILLRTIIRIETRQKITGFPAPAVRRERGDSGSTDHLSVSEVFGCGRGSAEQMLADVGGSWQEGWMEHSLRVGQHNRRQNATPQ